MSMSQSRAVQRSSSPNEDRGENQLVVYDLKGNDDTEEEVLPVQSQPLSSRTQCPSIGAFTVQCASCFKWRLMPSMQKYEEIREQLLENPFFCDTAREWKPDISCDVPADIYQDGTRLWAIDKPNISRPPAGWQRLLRIRGEGGTRFADVYYVAPSGKKLRSTVEVQKYLNDNSEYIGEGVKLSQFSFQIPKPLQDDYVRKRPARLLDSIDNTNTPVAKEANPLAWISPDDHISLQLGTPTESGLNNSHYQPSKKKKTSTLSIFGSNDELADR
ncbi:Methyl-CpG-binding domain-containing protein 2 [Arabidopsis thaliana]|uniref:Methyl-CpG-binding domain-containing protein 2 n=5 Tax=Arabidopsis TaxID=3701 RepID=MBD2_ARATH|nr:methyl-CPG-binding domain protein 02 [Arabidopsis thaliana]NP_001331130.1 methyl-CPG-binding domain protein 02 [Arabidopsis thaliana]NP_198383.1 methyl-CPG-binding domain protein 02 [Arabidopsis thaliana]NP_974850.1 methyl-CPG-binding domain protein 02 [Arabidopsis thaliana]Q8LA53.1 RecName: Full=Methyl-CpG-binding domain-containing protein 2; Short=AtMBD2; Short=MBD02; AltName: Full=Methyl-CpG-binding protein MBD2 [Arabidopsis thaliana]KAG7603910.1 Methyl-CpG DNA binding [Arabidopsis thali|eukprot:NP_001190421.1 methyl-CPG-binding domain protein 02 [Arabidopsis thaliana]